MRAAFLLIALAALCSACDKRTENLSAPPQTPQATPTASVIARVQAPAQPPLEQPASRCTVATPERAPSPVASGPAKGCPLNPVIGGVRLPYGEVVFPESGDFHLKVELAKTEAHRERGLMYRLSMGENEGMLFVFDRPEVHTFWMHNTCIPLDMLFITADGYISGIVENAPTLNDGARSINCPVSYVLEVNAGWSRRHKVRAGQMLKLPPR